jgi:hypothetical protein
VLRKPVRNDRVSSVLIDNEYASRRLVAGCAIAVERKKMSLFAKLSEQECAPSERHEHGGETAESQLEAQWKGLIHEGNDAFFVRQYAAADDAYRRAVDLIEENFGAWAARSANDAIAALVVSYLNLVDSANQQFQRDRAAYTLREIHCCLLLLARSPDVPERVQRAALRHSNQTFAAIRSFQANHGECVDVFKLIEHDCDLAAGLSN